MVSINNHTTYQLVKLHWQIVRWPFFMVSIIVALVILKFIHTVLKDFCMKKSEITKNPLFWIRFFPESCWLMLIGIFIKSY